MYSVLMSIYSKEKPLNLQESIESIVTQTVLPGEIVIVKDGELTKELNIVLNSFLNREPELFKVVSLEENVGLGKALAIGLKECSYNLVARMDSDDISRHDRFEKQIRYFKEDSNLDILGSYITEFEGNIHNKVGKRQVPLNEKEIIQFAKKRNPFNHVTVMFNKETVTNSGSYRKVSGLGYEDYDLWIRMLMANSKCKNIDESLVYVRVGKDMYKRRGNKERLTTALKFRYKMYKSGFCSLFDFIFASFANIFLAYSPNLIRSTIYKKTLRN